MEELTLLLSEVFGVYLMIVGAAIMLRQRYFVPVFGKFVEDRLMRAVVALAELLGGLFLVAMHNHWNTLPEIIITLIGWLAVIEATFYLLAPDDVVERMFKAFNVKWWYTFGGILSIVLGVYLAGSAFGWFV